MLVILILDYKHKTYNEYLPASIRSSFVTTAKVLLPSGSTSFAIFIASLVAISVLAAVTAKIMEFGLEIYFTIRFLIWFSISSGWSPMGT